MLLDMKAMLKATCVTLAVCAIWYFEEYKEFGALIQRQCDNVVGLVYFFILWYLFHEINRKENIDDKHE